MIDFYLGKNHLELVGAVCAAVLVVFPLLKLSICGVRKQIGRLSLYAKILLGFCIVNSIIVCGTKTNGVNNLPPQQIMSPGGGPFQTGFTGLTGFSGKSNLVNSVNPVQTVSLRNAFAERMARNWNIRGAFDDSFWLNFDDGFVFPEGTNHLAGVEVLASGEIWRSPFDSNRVVDIGVSVSIVPGLTSFGYEHTPSNTYRFSWTDAAVNRYTNNLMSASLELFRNGDSCVTTNGTSRRKQRVLPFPHNGFGQDDEWVVANFTNANEILAVGYPQWVDAQVGSGLLNGLYKLTVAVDCDLPETTFLTVGDYSVAITNAGDYVFLLGKGIDYPLSVFPETATNFTYTAVDDIVQMRTLPEGNPRSVGNGVWTTGEGLLETIVPMYPLAIGAGAAHITWHPKLNVSPASWHPSCFSSTRSFTAILSDLPLFAPSPEFHWVSEGDANVRIGNSDAETADVECIFPHSYGKDVSLRLSATVGTANMVSTFDYQVENFLGNGDEVWAYDTSIDPGLIVEAWPSVVFIEKWQPNFDEAGIVYRYNTDRAGTFTLTMSNNECQMRDLYYDPVQSGYTWYAEGPCSGEKHFFARNGTKSSSALGTGFTVAFTPEDESEETMSDFASVVFVEWETETKADWPTDKKRRTIGVCEEVSIKLKPSVPYVRLENHSNGTLRIGDKGTWSYTAPIDAAQDLISSAWFGDLFSFNVLAPTGYAARVTAIESDSRLYGTAGSFAAYFDLTLMPTNVSFESLQIEEVGMQAINVSGYFAEPRNAQYLFHSTADTWVDVKVGNKGIDKAQVAELDLPWGEGGGMTWPIPNRYRNKTNPSDERYFCNTDQRFFIDAAGTAGEEKFDWRITMTTNRNYTVERVDAQ